MARKLIDRKDILNDIVNVVYPKYFPDVSLDRGRVSVNGMIAEVQAKAIEDTVTLEQRRAENYCPELSNSLIQVRQTAKLRGVDVDYATPGKAFAAIGILKSDILSKGERSANGIKFIIDRRSTIIHNGVNFSLEDDIIIRAVQRSTGYVFAASYSGEHSSYESYIQMFEETDEAGQELVSMIVQIYQFNYNIQEKVVTDEIEFLYDGLSFDYDNKLAGFDVYFRQNANDVYKKLDKIHYLTTETTSAIYYNDDDDNILYVLNNPKTNIMINAMLKVEIRETLGVDGQVKLGDENTTFSLYRDSNYAYSGVNIYINMLSDTTAASDNDTIGDIKSRLIDAKVRRDNITTEHDILSYINDRDANVQIIKKRNDIMDHRYYLYTLLRHNSEIVPATTKRLQLAGIRSVLDYGDFDVYNATVDRKVLKAHNKFKLVVPDDESAEDYAIKVPRDEVEEEDEFYYTCPFMMLINDKSVAQYYYNSVNDSIVMNMKSITDLFPFQMIIRAVDIYRDSHALVDDEYYTFTIRGTMNTSDDYSLVDREGNVLDTEAVMCHLIMKVDNSPCAYLPMKIAGYNKNTREFTFTGKIHTTDYITEKNKLEVDTGLFKTGTTTNYNSVIDFSDASFEVYFMYKNTDTMAEYNRSDIIFTLLPSDYTSNYSLMCAYYNNANNPYNLLLEYSKFTISPVKVFPQTETTVGYSIGEVPFIEYNYGVKNIIDMQETFDHMFDMYGNLLKLSTSFDISLKFIATYGRSKYIIVTGGRDPVGNEIAVELANLNPTMYFKVYGLNIDVDAVRQFIYEYMRETYITGNVVFMSNVCTLVEQNFSRVKSIKYMGVDALDASFQEFTYVIPTFDNVDIITRFIPEQLNVTDIRIEIDET